MRPLILPSRGWAAVPTVRIQKGPLTVLQVRAVHAFSAPVLKAQELFFGSLADARCAHLWLRQSLVRKTQKPLLPVCLSWYFLVNKKTTLDAFVNAKRARKEKEQWVERLETKFLCQHGGDGVIGPFTSAGLVRKGHVFWQGCCASSAHGGCCDARRLFQRSAKVIVLISHRVSWLRISACRVIE